MSEHLKSMDNDAVLRVKRELDAELVRRGIDTKSAETEAEFRHRIANVPGELEREMSKYPDQRIVER